VRASQHAGIDQHRRVDLGAFLEMQPASVDRRLHPAEIHLVEYLGEDVVEAALGQTPVQRHLSALEALDAHTRARGLTLAAAAAGLAHAGADAATDALAALACPRPVGNLVEPSSQSPCLPPLRDCGAQ
jgi:hypothetical protein